MDSKRTELTRLVGELRQERESYIPHWQDLNKFIRPRSAKFLIEKGSRGDKRNQSIINNTATLASETGSAGMMSGVTSPARPWFKLSTGDATLDAMDDVKAWLHTVAFRMREEFGKSNLYTELPLIYADLIDYGTAAMACLESETSTVRFDHFPIGSYSIATDEEGRVDTIAREWQMTVRQLVQQFGKENCSDQVQSMYSNNSMGQWIEVAHVVSRNKNFKEGRTASKDKKWQSTYLETGVGNSADAKGDRFLREAGFDEFPVMCPRWSVTGEDVYGNSPAMNALGDIKALQLLEKRGMMMVDKGANPPMTAPGSLRNQRASLLPGDVTYVDVNQGQQGFQPVYEPNPTWLGAIDNRIAKHEQRIKRAFFEDLFLMLANMDGVQPRNVQEIIERKEEKLLQLGPVMDRLNDELFDPLIQRAFAIMLKKSIVDWHAGLPGLLPQPPEALQDVDLKVEYTSVMAQALKMVGLGSIERFAGFMGNLAAVDPSVMDKWNRDATIDEYGQAVGLAPKIINSDDEVAKVRGARAKAQQGAEQMAMMQQGVETAQTASQIDVGGGDNALSRVLGNLNPGGIAQPLGGA